MVHDNTDKKVTGNQTVTELYLISAYVHITRVHFCGLLRDPLSILDYIARVEIWLVNDELERTEESGNDPVKVLSWHF
jgi:hypothetical protein